MSEVGLAEVIMYDVPFCFLELSEELLLHLATLIFQRRESGREVEDGEVVDLAGTVFQLFATEPVQCERWGQCPAWMAKSLPPVDLESDLIPHA